MNTNMCIDSEPKTKEKFIARFSKETEFESTIMSQKFIERTDAKRYFDYWSYHERNWTKGAGWEIVQDTKNCFEAYKPTLDYGRNYIRIEWEQVD